MRSIENRPLVIAHRGAKAFAPENTMAAFQLAVDSKADGVEFDVKLTRDGEIIIIHDQTVDRTTNGQGKVKDFSLAQIRALDAGGFFSEAFRGEQVPLLRDVLHNLPEDFIINIELTNYADPFDGLAEKTARLVLESGKQEQVFFSSFFPFNLAITRRVSPQIPTAILAGSGLMGGINRSALMHRIAPFAVNPYYTDVTQKFVDRQHARNRKVIVWTVNDQAEMLRLAEMKVDGIISDDPALVRNTLGAA